MPAGALRSRRRDEGERAPPLGGDRADERRDPGRVERQPSGLRGQRQRADDRCPELLGEIPRPEHRTPQRQGERDEAQPRRDAGEDPDHHGRRRPERPVGLVRRDRRCLETEGGHVGSCAVELRDERLRHGVRGAGGEARVPGCRVHQGDHVVLERLQLDVVEPEILGRPRQLRVGDGAFGDRRLLVDGGDEPRKPGRAHLHACRQHQGRGAVLLTVEELAAEGRDGRDDGEPRDEQRQEPEPDVAAQPPGQRGEGIRSVGVGHVVVSRVGRSDVPRMRASLVTTST